MLSGGLRELMDAFKQQGHGEAADSWVASGPNKQIAPAQLEQAIGPDVLQTLSQQTGLSREEIYRGSPESARGRRQVHARRPHPQRGGFFVRPAATNADAVEMESARAATAVCSLPTRPGLARVAAYPAQVGQARLVLGEGWGGGSLLVARCVR